MTSFSGTKIDPFYVVDTHALIWYLTDTSKLGKNAKAIFEAAERGETQLVISAVVIAEMYFANAKSGLFADFWKTYQNLKSSPFCQFEPFLDDHVRDFDRDVAVPEMHDRIITGLARGLGASLLTHDSKIIASGIVGIVW